MNKFEAFWSFLACFLLLMFASFMIFISWIYYDAAMTMQSISGDLSAKHDRFKKRSAYTLDQNDWINIMDSCNEVV